MGTRKHRMTVESSPAPCLNIIGEASYILHNVKNTTRFEAQDRYENITSLGLVIQRPSLSRYLFYLQNPTSKVPSLKRRKKVVIIIQKPARLTYYRSTPSRFF